MSPEQSMDGRAVDLRSDVYALGCVTYEALTGEPPFDGPTGLAIVTKHATQPPPSLRVLRPDLGDDIDRCITRALAKVPSERFDSAGSFASALASGARGTSANSPA
jgi:serine/threonine-protein kinase